MRLFAHRNIAIHESKHNSSIRTPSDLTNNTITYSFINRLVDMMVRCAASTHFGTSSSVNICAIRAITCLCVCASWKTTPYVHSPHTHTHGDIISSSLAKSSHPISSWGVKWIANQPIQNKFVKSIIVIWCFPNVQLYMYIYVTTPDEPAEPNNNIKQDVVACGCS